MLHDPRTVFGLLLAALALAGCDDPCKGDACADAEAEDSADSDDSSGDASSETGGEALRYCSDADMDGYADLDNCQEVASGDEPPPGWLPEDEVEDEDCDDADASAFPGAAALDDPLACMQDGDRDGYGNAAASGAVSPGSDCDDADPLTLDCGSWCADLDGDGRGDNSGDGANCVEAEPDAAPAGYVANALDCVDTAAEVYTGAATSEAHLCTADLDGDGYGDPDASTTFPGASDGSDCLDSDPEVIVCVEMAPACVEISAGASAQLMATPEGGAGGYFYAWEPPDVIDDPHTDHPHATPAQTTAYTVDVTDGHGNVAVAGMTVHVGEDPWVLEGGADDCEAVGLLGAPALFEIAPDGARACTTTNSDPTALVCPMILDQARITGELAVETQADNDFIGFVWGWQSADQFYLLSWKQVSEGWGGCNAPAGITVKRVDRQQDFSAEDFACAVDTANATVLLTPAQTTAAGWIGDRSYAVEVQLGASQTTITITDTVTMAVVTSFVVDDASSPRGKFGGYAYSEEQACLGPWRSGC